MPTIKISDETKQKLNQIGGELSAKNGARRTYEEVILELIGTWKERLKKGQP